MNLQELEVGSPLKTAKAPTKRVPHSTLPWTNCALMQILDML